MIEGYSDGQCLKAVETLMVCAYPVGLKLSESPSLEAQNAAGPGSWLIPASSPVPPSPKL